MWKIADISKELEIKSKRESIHKKLLEINANNSPGPDNIHPRVVKELADELVDPLFMIFDLSLNTFCVVNGVYHSKQNYGIHYSGFDYGISESKLFIIRQTIRISGR